MYGDNYNSVEAQDPTVYSPNGMPDPYDEALGVVESNRDSYDDIIDSWNEDEYVPSHEEEIQELHMRLEKAELEVALTDVENNRLARDLEDVKTELDATLLRNSTLAREVIMLRENNDERGKSVLELRKRLRHAEHHADDLNDHIYELTMTL